VIRDTPAPELIYTNVGLEEFIRRDSVLGHDFRDGAVAEGEFTWAFWGRRKWIVGNLIRVKCAGRMDQLGCRGREERVISLRLGSVVLVGFTTASAPTGAGAFLTSREMETTGMAAKSWAPVAGRRRRSPPKACCVRGRW